MLIIMLICFMLATAMTAGGFYGFKIHQNKTASLLHNPLKS